MMERVSDTLGMSYVYNSQINYNWSVESITKARILDHSNAFPLLYSINY